MKLRIIKKEKNFVPQVFNTKLNRWTRCYIDESLDTDVYHTVEEAKELINEYKKQHPKPEVVWEEEY